MASSFLHTQYFPMSEYIGQSCWTVIRDVESTKSEATLKNSPQSVTSNGTGAERVSVGPFLLPRSCLTCR